MRRRQSPETLEKPGVDAGCLWPPEIKAEGLYPSLCLLEMLTWQFSLQAIAQSLTRLWCKSETHTYWKIKTRGPWRQLSFSLIQTQVPFAPFQPSEVMGFSAAPVICFSLPGSFPFPFPIMVSLPHVPENPTSGHCFLFNCICVIFCDRRPLSPKSPHLYPVVVPAPTGSFKQGHQISKSEKTRQDYAHPENHCIIMWAQLHPFVPSYTMHLLPSFLGEFHSYLGYWWLVWRWLRNVSFAVVSRASCNGNVFMDQGQVDLRKVMAGIRGNKLILVQGDAKPSIFLELS